MLRKKPFPVFLAPTTSELVDAEREWLVDLQACDYITELRLLRNSTGTSSSRVRNLCLFVDSNTGLLHCKNILSFSAIEASTCPVLFPLNREFQKLYITRCHNMVVYLLP